MAFPKVDSETLTMWGMAIAGLIIGIVLFLTY